MTVRTLFFLFLLGSTFTVSAKNSVSYTLDSTSIELSTVVDSIPIEQEVKRKNVRIKAIILTILTGPLGGHRVYLRTRPGAPIIYAVTLGGFGILPLVDLAHLIFKKDISSFEENSKIMMWTK